jgi:hypothetical protein
MLPSPQANSTYTTQVKSNAIKFLHASCFSLTTATWTKAIDQGFFRSIPILTADDVQRNLPKSMATTMGHLDQGLGLGLGLGLGNWKFGNGDWRQETGHWKEEIG